MTLSVREFASTVPRADRDCYEWIGDAFLGEMLCRVVYLLRYYLPLYGVDSKLTPYQTFHDFVTGAMTNKTLSEALLWLMQQEEETPSCSGLERGGRHRKLSTNNVLKGASGKRNFRSLEQHRGQLPPLVALFPEIVNYSSPAKSTIKGAADLLEAYFGWLIVTSTKRKRGGSGNRKPTPTERVAAIDFVLSSILHAYLLDLYSGDAVDQEISERYGVDHAITGGISLNKDEYDLGGQNANLFSVLDMDSSDDEDGEDDNCLQYNSSSNSIVIQSEENLDSPVLLEQQQYCPRSAISELFCRLRSINERICSFYYFVGKQFLRCRISAAIWSNVSVKNPSKLTKLRQKLTITGTAKKAFSSFVQKSKKNRSDIPVVRSSEKEAEIYVQTIGCALLNLLMPNRANSCSYSAILNELLDHISSQLFSSGGSAVRLHSSHAMYNSVDGRILGIENVNGVISSLPRVYDIVGKPFDNARSDEERFQREIKSKSDRVKVENSPFEAHIQKLTQSQRFRRLNNIQKWMIKFALDKFPAYVLAVENICLSLRGENTLNKTISSDELPKDDTIDELSQGIIGVVPFATFTKTLAFSEDTETKESLEVHTFSDYVEGIGLADCTKENGDFGCCVCNALGSNSKRLLGMRDEMCKSGMSQSKKRQLREKYGTESMLSAKSGVLFFEEGVYRQLAYAIADYYELHSGSK